VGAGLCEKQSERGVKTQWVFSRHILVLLESTPGSLESEGRLVIKAKKDMLMTLVQKIFQKVQKLPESVQAEVLDFIEFIDQKKGHPSDDDLKDFSLSSAMRGMEDEPLSEYDPTDLKEKFS